MTDLRQQISAALAAFTQRPLANAAIALFETLGYRSKKRLALDNTPDAFLDQCNGGRAMGDGHEFMRFSELGAEPPLIEARARRTRRAPVRMI